MAQCVFIVQGEGRGHMSQSMALKEYLEDSGHKVEAVFTGCSTNMSLPQYYRDFFDAKVEPFHSPYFLQTPNRKGIYVVRTLLFNLTRSLLYLREARRLREKINALAPDVVFNFYDVVGAFALGKVNPGIKRIGVGHHFFLHLDGYRCNRDSAWQRWLLKMHTKLVLKSCDQVLALSFREEQGDQTIKIVPPLIRKTFREMTCLPGESYLVYLLHEGYVYDLMNLSRDDPDFSADVFIAQMPEIDLPSGIRLHPLNDEKFREMMAGCKGLITTAGFDTVAEAAYHGIPLVVVPAQHHFEQRCNAEDVERSGIGVAAEQLSPGIQHQLDAFNNYSYREWVDRAGEMITKGMAE